MIRSMEKLYESSFAKYIRMPKPNKRCELSGLSRSTLYRLCVPCAENNWRPPVRSIRVKTKVDGRTGCRLIDTESMLAYLNSI
jgi:hypothetical protein